MTIGPRFTPINAATTNRRLAVALQDLAVIPTVGRAPFAEGSDLIRVTRRQWDALQEAIRRLEASFDTGERT